MASFIDNITTSGTITMNTGLAVASVTTMPDASSDNKDCLVLYVGTTGTYVKGATYLSNGTTWTKIGRTLTDSEISLVTNAIQQGGTLSKPLKVTGGDQATVGKIILDNSGNGQITDTSTATLLGFQSDSALTIGSASYSTALRGKGSRPTYNGNNMALQSDVNAKATAVKGSNLSVSWVADSTVTGYSYKGTILLTGVTSDHVPMVSFDTAQAKSGNYCPVSESGTNAVYIWSKTNTAITVPSVVAVKP